ncbi:MAG: hemerythrin domain-containing protein [Acidimicrobiales bacterium]|nr:hemerythrin domain-containing protein [Acidimicrobiales bacterium]
MTLIIDAPVPASVPAMATVDLYLDIHKGIRADLFSVTGRAGSLDPADAAGRAALAEAVRWSVDLLVSHAEHEDTVVQPVLEVERPDLAEVIATDHHGLEPRMDGLVALADAAADVAGAEARSWLHALYLDLALFTGDYLRHQDTEERVVMPALEAAIGPDAVRALEGAIISSIPPDEMAASLAVMLPAMNLDDRAGLLGGMQAGAPADVFAGVWALVGSVLDPADHERLGERLGLA